MDTKRRKKILLVKHPYDGHERGYYIIAKWLRDAGMEVVLGGGQLALEIVDTATQEDVDVIGYRIMSVAPDIVVSELFKKLKKKGVDIPVIVGGIISEQEITNLKKLGVVEVFPPGSSLDSIVSTVEKLCSRPVISDINDFIKAQE